MPAPPDAPAIPPSDDLLEENRSAPVTAQPRSGGAAAEASFDQPDTAASEEAQAPAGEPASHAPSDPPGAAAPDPAGRASDAATSDPAGMGPSNAAGGAAANQFNDPGTDEAGTVPDPATDRATVGGSDAPAAGAIEATPGDTVSDVTSSRSQPPTIAAAETSPDDGAVGASIGRVPLAPGDGVPPVEGADPAFFAHALRIAEALVFASDRPVTPARLQSALPPGCDARAVLTALAAACAGRPVQLAEVAGGFAFRTAPELAPAITRVVEVPRRLPRAAMETLSIVAYHQPVTRAEIEEIRGASLSHSTLEALLDLALIAPRGHKEVPGRPSLWGTTPRFLEQFGLKALADLPRREELVNEPTLPLSAPMAQRRPEPEAAATAPQAPRRSPESEAAATPPQPAEA